MARITITLVSSDTQDLVRLKSLVPAVTDYPDVHRR
jgi:hypothetical protein